MKRTLTTKDGHTLSNPDAIVYYTSYLTNSKEKTCVLLIHPMRLKDVPLNENGTTEVHWYFEIEKAKASQWVDGKFTDCIVKPLTNQTAPSVSVD